MKTIKVKPYNNNKIIEAIKLDGNVSDWNGPLQRRIIDALRLAKECRAAAQIARNNGADEDADWLERRAEDYEQAAANWNQDTFGGESDGKSEAGEENKAGGESEGNDEENAAEKAAIAAQNSANRAKANAEAAEQAAEEAQAEADEADSDGDSEKANEAKRKAESAKEAAQRAQEAADAAQQAADEAKEAAEKGDAESAAEAASEAKAAEAAARKAANEAMGVDEKSQGGEDDSRGEDESESEGENGKSKGNESDGEASGESEGESDGENEDSAESESDGDGEDNADEDDEGGDKGEKPEKQQKPNKPKQSKNQGKQGKQNGGEQSQSDSSDGADGDSEDDDPVKDPFADDEDIPQLPTGGMSNGKEPRDPTIDDLIKHLSELSGEAKRGAIDGLKDLLGKKTESLGEAFSKSIREFDDAEWDDLNDETIERIERVKKLDVIDKDEQERRKAKFKGWSGNQVSRQELSDEENQNIQRDTLARRARETELNKYKNLKTLDDFKLDFEACIKDQVTQVLQAYQSYDEINPEYEGEDVIVKADLERILPSKDIPTIAVFFDRSSSWDAHHLKKGEQAIATVKQKYVDTGMCKMDLYYFDDRVHNHLWQVNGGTTEAWPYIIDTIKKGDYKNVVIMSDSDIERQNNHGESYTVLGCVWWIWKNGSRADRCTQELVGMRHNFECEFN